MEEHIMLFNDYYFAENHPMNVKDTGDGFEIELRAVGLTKEDISMEYKPDNILWIKAGDREKEKNEEFVRHEFWRDWFDTKIQLPAGIDETKISAKVENGILRIEVGKNKVDNRKIEVE